MSSNALETADLAVSVAAAAAAAACAADGALVHAGRAAHGAEPAARAHGRAGAARDPVGRGRGARRAVEERAVLEHARERAPDALHGVLAHLAPALAALRGRGADEQRVVGVGRGGPRRHGRAVVLRGREQVRVQLLDRLLAAVGAHDSPRGVQVVVLVQPLQIAVARHRCVLSHYFPPFPLLGLFVFSMREWWERREKKRKSLEGKTSQSVTVPSFSLFSFSVCSFCVCF